MLKDNYDVVIIGAGPAGSAAATFLAQYNYDVLVVERDKFPRHHIGESLMPSTYPQFKRLGVLDKLKKTGFVRKHSVQFVNEKGKASKPFYFNERNPGESSVTWQVERSQFDSMMLQNAQEYGATASQETKVVDIIIEQDNQITGVIIQKNNTRKEIKCKVVIDASGTSAFIARKLKIYEPDPMLRKGVAYTYFRGDHLDCKADGGATIILHTENKNGWFWYIPLKNNVVSVGIVSDIGELFADKSLGKCGVFMREMNKCPALQEKIGAATQIAEVNVCKDFSYKSEYVAGNGYVLIGDAFSFIDPVYSSGVFLALKSAEFAADTIHEAFQTNNFSASQLRSFEQELQSGIEPIRKLVYSFYNNNFSFAKFLKAYPQYHDTLVDILVGDVFKDGIQDIFDAMNSFLQNQTQEPINV